MGLIKTKRQGTPIQVKDMIAAKAIEERKKQDKLQFEKAGREIS